jgi:small conductance mechanosensitive channel
MIQDRAASVGVQILGALVLYIVGRWLITLVVSTLQRALARHQLDPTVFRFIGNALSVALNITLVVAILGYFGVQTTIFAALIAATALAIGTAWAGLLANFAAGAFLIVLRPFKVGDFISAGGVTGTVHEIGLFVTSFDTPDNVRTFVGNNEIFSDTMHNFTANSYRRVELTAQISGATDFRLAIQRLKDRIATIANVCKTPAPEVTILTFNPLVPSWRSGLTVTMSTIGRFTSMRTSQFARCWATMHSRVPHILWGIGSEKGGRGCVGTSRLPKWW